MPQPIHPWFRNAFLSGFLLSLMAAIQLFVLGEHTESYFAWTIQSALTASTLGGFYFGSMTFGYLSARETVWANVRGPAVGLFFFVTVSMAATLLHLDKFHFASASLLPRLAAWIWLAIYLLIPAGLAASFFMQTKVRGADPQPSASLPTGYRLLLLVHSAAGILSALALFFTPQFILPFWPWTLTPLTARALSAWLFSFGILNAVSLREDDWPRLRIMSTAYVVSAAFALLALLRYHREADLTSIGGAFYLLYLGIMLASGAYGWHRSTRN